MPTRSVELTDHFDSLIADGVASGRYSDASEAVQAGLTLLEQQEKEDQAKLDKLREIAREAFAALDRGEGVSFTSMEDLDAWINEIGDEVSAEIAAERKYA
jgi:antitoxin ParD1/3/4